MSGPADCRSCLYSSGGHCAKHPAPPRAELDDQALVTAIDEHERDVTDWESQFVESVMERLDGGRALTPMQRAKALEILDRLDGLTDNAE